MIKFAFTFERICFLKFAFDLTSLVDSGCMMCICIYRAEKSEVLSEELLELERRVDHIRLVCVDTTQKLVACQPSAIRNIDPDKRRVCLVSSAG